MIATYGSVLVLLLSARCLVAIQADQEVKEGIFGTAAIEWKSAADLKVDVMPDSATCPLLPNFEAREEQQLACSAQNCRESRVMYAGQDLQNVQRPPDFIHLQPTLVSIAAALISSRCEILC